LISLHNYFIIHDIKYFFLNKINQTIQGGKKNFQGGKLPKVLLKSTVFQNPGGAAAPWPSVHPLLAVASGLKWTGRFNLFWIGP
jgi:hypothetical protein